MDNWGRVAAAAAISGIAWTGSAAAESGAPAWSYTGEDGPAKWGTLAPGYAACSTGRAQSPVDLGAGAPRRLPAVTVDYKPLALTIINNGHTVQVEVGNGSRITLDGKAYELLQFHFHTPSEHTVGGRAYPAEVHFVHRAADGELAVIGAFIDGGPGRQALAEVAAHAPEVQSGAWTYTWVTVDPGRILPGLTSYWSYDGSLTTPACGEGVRWMVRKQPLALSKEHIAQLGTAMGSNARPVQPLNGRVVATR